MKNSNHSSVRCAIVLAAGEGLRLRPFIWRLRGDLLPKQYVRFIGVQSMLEQTFQRVEKLIDPERIYTVIDQDHLKYPEVRRQLSSRPKGTVIIQPENRDTGPGLLLPLMHLIKRHPDSVVAVFPADHFIAEENIFMGHVEFACRSVERDASRLVLLGIKPLGPETEYGYILPDPGADEHIPSGIRDVSRFVEKPGPEAALELVQRGGLWNTLVMAFNAKTVLDRFRELFPSLYDSFQRIGKTVDPALESEIVGDVYRKIEAFNFSKGFLEAAPVPHRLRLSVLPVKGVQWNDWGSENRILTDLQRFGYLKTFHGNNKRIPLYGVGPSEFISR